MTPLFWSMLHLISLKNSFFIIDDIVVLWPRFIFEEKQYYDSFKSVLCDNILGQTVIKTRNTISITVVEGIMEIRFGSRVRATFTIGRIQL